VNNLFVNKSTDQFVSWWLVVCQSTDATEMHATNATFEAMSL